MITQEKLLAWYYHSSDAINWDNHLDFYKEAG